MKFDNNRIITFEHRKLVFDLSNKDQKLIHDALENYHGNYSPYFSLIKNGVQFNSFVGVLQVGNITIEVLPKADQGDDKKWRRLLIDMIHSVWGFDVKTTGSGALKLKSNSILDLYFELFVQELEYLLHRGLIKKYRQNEGNQNALKGALQFSKHITKNLTHKERFFIKYTEYSKEHPIHQVLYKTLKLLSFINSNNTLKSRIGSLLLSFPELSEIKVTESTFDKIVYDRKNTHYKTALDIAKLILLNYHPDVTKGRHDVLALMFDMNQLWEQFIFVTLKKKLTTHQVSAQVTRHFWKPQSGYSSKMRPDLVLKCRESNQFFVLDTKWKNLNGYNPSPEDLRQMYVYHRFYGASKVALLYPSETTFEKKGNYFSSSTAGEMSEKECSIIHVSTSENIKDWQHDIVSQISGFLKNETRQNEL